MSAAARDDWDETVARALFVFRTHMADAASPAALRDACEVIRLEAAGPCDTCQRGTLAPTGSRPSRPAKRRAPPG